MKKKLIKFLVPIFLLGATASCKNHNKSNTISNVEKEITGITVTTKPNKTSYYVGDSFNPEGMVVSYKYNDETTEVIKDYKYDVANPLTQYSNIVKITKDTYSTNLTISVDFEGNDSKYSVENTGVLSSSKLTGKTYYFLGSSVTYGSQAKGESFANFIAKRNNCTCIKEAVSGTTLGDKTNSYGESYVTRFNKYLEKKSRVTTLDGFICQLSTNDASNNIELGSISSSKESASFDVTTSIGAIEYIIAKVNEEYNCPIYFYTNPYFANDKTSNYRLLVDALLSLQDKWNITILNLFDDEDFNNITDEQRKLYMADKIHPTKAGYREWWTPRFEEMLSSI